MSVSVCVCVCVCERERERETLWVAFCERRKILQNDLQVLLLIVLTRYVSNRLPLVKIFWLSLLEDQIRTSRNYEAS